MKIIDLTHEINEKMTVFSGSETPGIKDVSSIENDGFAEKKLSFYSHTGTHIDAPRHIIASGKGLDDFPMEKFFGEGVIVDLMEKNSIEKDILIGYEEQIKKCDFVLLNTGWDKYWGTCNYNKGFPRLTEEAAHWLSEQCIKGVGIDAISVDEVDSITLEIHKIFLGKDILIIENLKNLSLLSYEKFIFSCFPLKFENCDGSPTRALAILA